MAAPTQPTTTSIVTEAYRRYFGVTSYTPTSTQINTAISEGIEKVKRDMWALSQRWRPLMKIGYDMTVKGISKYPYPADYERMKLIEILEGTSTGTLQSATSTSATLAAAEGISQDEAEGALLAITSGTGVDQALQIDDFNTTTKAVTMAESWTTTPTATSTYLVAVTQYLLWKEDMLQRARLRKPFLKARPTDYHPIDDIYSGSYELTPIPDKVYVVRMEYYVNLLLLDTSATIYNKLLYNWAGLWTQGVYTWLLESFSDSRYRGQEQIYTAMLRRMAAKESDYHNQAGLQMKVQRR